MEWNLLPGGELIREGLGDAAAGRTTIASLLVAIGAPRLRRAGLEVPDNGVIDPEHRLYELLAADDSDAAHSRYNALIRQLVSFERALEAAMESIRRPGAALQGSDLQVYPEVGGDLPRKLFC